MFIFPSKFIKTFTLLFGCMTSTLLLNYRATVLIKCSLKRTICMEITIISENVISRKKPQRKPRNQTKKTTKSPHQNLNLRALDQNEAFLPGGICSVFNTSEDKLVRKRLIFSFSKCNISSLC